jgi:hypothetical protein
VSGISKILLVYSSANPSSFSPRKRRIKCDEARPECANCVRANHQCNGYPASRRLGEAAVPIAPRPRPRENIHIVASSPNYSSSTSSSGASSSPSPPRPSAAVAHTLRRARFANPPYTPIVASHKPVPLALAPPLRVPGGYAFDAKEGQYFQVFRTRTAGELSGFFDSDFWTRSVLQESHWEPSVRHAVVALGALYKTLETSSESPPGSPHAHHEAETVRDHYNFALAQQNKAIKRLRESIDMEKNVAQSRRTTLISNVLHICFQSFIGDHKAAIVHVQSGLRILEERRPESTHPPASRGGAVVEDELVQIFTRLAIQAKSYDMAFHFPAPYVIQLAPKAGPSSPTSPSLQSDAASTASFDAQIPDIFTTSQEARSSLDTLTERIMRFNEDLSSLYAGPNNLFPSSVKSHGLGYRKQLQQWSDAFDPLLQNRRDPGVSKTERAGMDVLKMIHIMTTVLFLMGFSNAEVDFDGFLPQFHQIVNLAKEVVVDEELALAEAQCGDSDRCRHRWGHGGNQIQFPGIATVGHPADGSYSHLKPSFALDLGIVPPLFVVATKCRDRTLRRDAIRLLMMTPRREGMWDSLLCGRVGMWLMEVEEEGMLDFATWDFESTNELVVEDKRVMIKEILFDLQSRSATLRCGTRGARDDDVDPRAKETDITW